MFVQGNIQNEFAHLVLAHVIVASEESSLADDLKNTFSTPVRGYVSSFHRFYPKRCITKRQTHPLQSKDVSARTHIHKRKGVLCRSYSKSFTFFIVMRAVPRATFIDHISLQQMRVNSCTLANVVRCGFSVRVIIVIQYYNISIQFNTIFNRNESRILANNCIK